MSRGSVFYMCFLLLVFGAASLHLTEALQFITLDKFSSHYLDIQCSICFCNTSLIDAEGLLHARCSPPFYEALLKSFLTLVALEAVFQKEAFMGGPEAFTASVIDISQMLVGGKSS